MPRIDRVWDKRPNGLWYVIPYQAQSDHDKWGKSPVYSDRYARVANRVRLRLLPISRDVLVAGHPVAPEVLRIALSQIFRAAADNAALPHATPGLKIVDSQPSLLA
jgi:hypothetical protein